ncbi:MAG: hypothetical protein PCFJNLEI_00050 [Verrucomicrobiae bacterium]|nr:hypothetical protein [Verrucomicrobiae bacterium]
MKIIDACVGLGPWGWRNPILPGTTAEIIAILDYCGIDSALVHRQLPFVSATNANVSLLREINGDSRFVPAFLLAPQTYNNDPAPVDYLAAMRAAGAKAAWLRPTWQSHGMASWMIDDLLALCVAHRLPLFVQIMDGGVSYDDVHRMCSAFPELKLVLTGIGYRADAHLFPLLRRHRELRICTNYYCTTLAPERFVQHFGPERMLFASGLPFNAPGGAIAMVSYSQLDDEAKQKIFAGNIQQLMNEVRL